jgi:hypothetical protein
MLLSRRLKWDEKIKSQRQEVVSIIFGTGASIWTKRNFGLTGHHHPPSSPLLNVCAVPSASAIFKCILEAMFCESVQYHLRFCLDHFNCVKMAAFQCYFQSGKQRKRKAVGTIAMFLIKKFPGGKGSLRPVRFCAASASCFVAKVRGGVFSHFHAVAVKRHSSMRIDCLACQDELFVNNHLDVKENDEHALDFTLHMSCLFRSPWVCTFRVRLMLSSLNAYIIIARLSEVSEVCIKFDAVPLSDPSQNHIRSDTRLQIKGRKRSARPPNCMKFCTLTPKICWYYHVSLHRVAVTAVQMAAPVPEIIDTSNSM